MSTYISGSTAATFVNLKFDPRADSTEAASSSKVVLWDSREHPDWVVSMSHVMNANGDAGRLSLELYQRIDPYSSLQSEYSEVFYREGITDDIDENDPAFVLGLLNSAFNTISFQYGYAQSTGESEWLDVNDTVSKNATSTSWFKMIITSLTYELEANGVKISIGAVSTLVNEGTLFNSEGNYDFLEDSQSKLPSGSYVQETTRPFTSLVMRIADYMCTTASSKTVKFKWNPVIAKLSDLSTNCDLTIRDPENGQTDDNSNVFCLSGTGEGIYSFVNSLVSKITLGLRSTEVVTYERDGVKKSCSYPWVYYNGWKLIITDTDEDGCTVTLDYTYKVYFDKDIEDLNKGSVSDEYVPLKIETNSGSSDSSLGTLIYNGGAFNRDIFDTQEISGAALSKYSDKYYRNGLSAKAATVVTDIISINLTHEILAGVAGVIKGRGMSLIDSTGTEQTGSYSLSVETGGIDGFTIANTLNRYTANYNEVLNQQYASLSVTIPGTNRVLQTLSYADILIYVSNRLSSASGTYMLMTQTDSITSGVYTTTLEMSKVFTANGEVVYDSDIDVEDATNNLGLPENSSNGTETRNGITLYNTNNLTESVSFVCTCRQTPNSATPHALYKKAFTGTFVESASYASDTKFNFNNKIIKIPASEVTYNMNTLEIKVTVPNTTGTKALSGTKALYYWTGTSDSATGVNISELNKLTNLLLFKDTNSGYYINLPSNICPSKGQTIYLFIGNEDNYSTSNTTWNSYLPACIEFAKN